MKKTYKGTIYYKMKASHPDKQYIDPVLAENVFKHDDIYIFNYHYSDDFINDYIKKDLVLIAGGGYSTNHIYNITVKIERID